MSGIELVCCVALGDAQVYHHLMPLAEHRLVDRIWLVRTHLPRTGILPKTALVSVPVPRALRLPSMVWHAGRLARRNGVRGMISFNPFPYGLVQLPASAVSRVPLHMGLIGSDWYRDARGAWGPLLKRALRRADFVTVSGPMMRSEVLSIGIDSERLAVLPHSVDVARFDRTSGDIKRDIDVIFVGQLIRRKRVDRILDAFARVAASFPKARLALIGRGPEESALRDRCRQHGIDGQVTFAGYVDDVAPWLLRGRIFVMASEMEGLPFALIEAQCAGLVPISTPAGTIADHVTDGVDGFIVNSGTPVDLANRISALLGDEKLLRQMQAETLKTREHYRHDAAAKVWTPWLERIANL